VDTCDVLVIGGGPAGSSCARTLAAAGLDVVVVDRSRFPRDKVCAGWITPQVLETLSIDAADYRKDRVLQPIRGFRVSRFLESRDGSPEADADFGSVVSYGIRRCEFDHYLLERSGARLRLGRPIRELRADSGRWRLDDALSARFLVGAGGHFCPVARRLGATPGASEPTVVAREIELPLDGREARRPVHPELPALFFAGDLRGYGWVVRKGDWLNVGLGRQDTHAFPQRVQAFLGFLEQEGRIPPGLAGGGGLRGHAYLLYDEAPRPLGGDGALLVGDAAGMAYARSGEGIRPGIESGILAARALLQGGLGPGALPLYQRGVRQRFGVRHGRTRPGPTDWLPARWRGPLSGRVLAWPWFARNVVVGRWFLHRELSALTP
jgi:flavin-dependent dehydrogenase